MAKFYGMVGYAKAADGTDGIWTDTIVERPYMGDELRNTARIQSGDKVNDDIVSNNLISIVADAFAFEQFFAIKYVRWRGTNWKVTNVEVQRPRLILTIGGVYNGETAGTPGSP